MESDVEGVSVGTVQISPSDGQFKEGVTTFRYLSGAASYDACSTFDRKHEVFYYAVDFQSSFIFAVDVKHNTILPPISIPGATFVTHLVWDESKGRIFALAGFAENTIDYVFSFGANGDLPTTLVANLSSTGYRYFEFAAFDTSKGNYYFSYYGNQGQRVGYFNVDTGFDSVQSFQVTCPSTNATLNWLYYDNDNSILNGLVSDDDGLTYNFVQISATGTDCTASPIPIEPNGIIIAVTYNTDDQILYVCVGTNGGPSLLYVYDVQAKKTTSTQLSDLPSDIQIAF